MKLIDLLVQELPKRGGWPDCVDSIYQDHDGKIYAWTGSSCKLPFRTGIIADNCRPYGLDVSIENIVTRNQYKSVLSLSQKPAWSGEGLPPAGCECEAKYRESDSAEWFLFSCVGVDCGVAFGWAGKEAVTLGKGSYEFRPLRSESEMKHEAVLESICAVLEMVAQDYKREDEAKLIYEAIAAGKIPGVKLDD